MGRDEEVKSQQAGVAGLPPPLEDAYELLGTLGAGGMGQVLRARHRTSGDEVAVKVHPTVADPELRRRFRREAEALERVEHPNVVRLRDYGEWPEGQYLVMDRLEGASLDRAGKMADPLPVLLDIAEGLAAVHAAGLVHRDVKPSNMVVTAAGRGVLIDLGLALDPAHTALTRDGAVVGSAAFLAPEVIRGERAGPAADWYAWGVSLYQLAEGSLPYDVSALLRVASGVDLPPIQFHALNPRGPRARLVRLLTEADPERRPQDLSALRRLLAESPEGGVDSSVDPRMVTTLTHEIPKAARGGTEEPGQKRWRAAGIAGALVLVLALVYQGVGASPSPPKASPATRAYLRGLSLTRGDAGAPDQVAAARAFREAADLGHAEAALNLGLLHHSGRGVERDLAAAAAWFAKAAEAGHPRATARLGLLYERGRGVPRDRARAARLYRQAAEGGNGLGAGNLGTLFYNGWGVPKDRVEAVRWLRRGADLGDAAALRNLGHCYERGQGVEVDPDQALEHYRRAAAAGDAEARRRVARLEGSTP